MQMSGRNGMQATGKREVAEGYDSVADRIGMSPGHYAVCLRAAGGPLDGLRVLDLGCGGGHLLQALERHAGTRGVGLDISQELCRRARALSGAPVARGDVERPPFPPEGFDLVFLTEVIEHLPDPVAALKGIRTLLVPGGRLVISAPNRDWPRYPRYARRHQAYQPVDDRWYTVSELCGFLEESGLRVTTLDGYGSLYGGGMANAALAALLNVIVPATRTRRKRIIICATRPPHPGPAVRP